MPNVKCKYIRIRLMLSPLLRYRRQGDDSDEQRQESEEEEDHSDPQL